MTRFRGTVSGVIVSPLSSLAPPPRLPLGKPIKQGIGQEKAPLLQGLFLAVSSAEAVRRVAANALRWTCMGSLWWPSALS